MSSSRCRVSSLRVHMHGTKKKQEERKKNRTAIARDKCGAGTRIMKSENPFREWDENERSVSVDEVPANGWRLCRCFAFVRAVSGERFIPGALMCASE